MTNKDKAKNLAQITKGNAKETFGKTTGDNKLEVNGKADQTQGNIKQAGERVKDAFKK